MSEGDEYAEYDFEPSSDDGEAVTPPSPSELVTLRRKEYGEQSKTLPQRIGELFALGCGTAEIIETVIDEGLAEDKESALQGLKAMYDSWSNLNDALSITLSDTKNWHIFMRHELLKDTLKLNPRVALAILESLADIQRIKISADANLENIPLSINLIAKIDQKPSDEVTDNTGESVVEPKPYLQENK